MMFIRLIGGAVFKVELRVQAALDAALAAVEDDLRETWPEMPEDELRKAAINIIERYMEQRE